MQTGLRAEDRRRLCSHAGLGTANGRPKAIQQPQQQQKPRRIAQVNVAGQPAPKENRAGFIDIKDVPPPFCRSYLDPSKECEYGENCHYEHASWKKVKDSMKAKSDSDVDIPKPTGFSQSRGKGGGRGASGNRGKGDKGRGGANVQSQANQTQNVAKTPDVKCVSCNKNVPQ